MVVDVIPRSENEERSAKKFVDIAEVCRASEDIENRR